jgi:hypothetical protein
MLNNNNPINLPGTQPACHGEVAKAQAIMKNIVKNRGVFDPGVNNG